MFVTMICKSLAINELLPRNVVSGTLLGNVRRMLDGTYQACAGRYLAALTYRLNRR